MASDICYVCGTRNMRGSVCLTCCPDGDPRLKPANTRPAPAETRMGDDQCLNQWGDPVTTQEAAADLYAAFRASPTGYQTIGYRSDLWTVLAECLKADKISPAPAATDTGLETVAYQFYDNGEWSETFFPEDRKADGRQVRELVTRSQAVELLAGRDTVIEIQADSIDKLARKVQHWQDRADKAEQLLAAERAWAKDRGVLAVKLALENSGLKGEIDTLEADNAAQAARIKELEQELTDRKHGGRWSEMVEALEAKLAAAEKALEPFADIADLIDAETEGMAETDELVLHFHDYEFAKWPVALFRQTRAVLGGEP